MVPWSEVLDEGQALGARGVAEMVGRGVTAADQNNAFKSAADERKLRRSGRIVLLEKFSATGYLHFAASNDSAQAFARWLADARGFLQLKSLLICCESHLLWQQDGGQTDGLDNPLSTIQFQT